MTKSACHIYELCADFLEIKAYNKKRKKPPIHYIVFATPKENTVLRKKESPRLAVFLLFYKNMGILCFQMVLQVKKITKYAMMNNRRKQSVRQTIGGRNGGIYDYSGKRKTQLYE